MNKESNILQNSNWILRYNINKKYENWKPFKQKVKSSFEPAKTKYWILPSTPHSRVGENRICVWGVPLKIWHYMPFWFL